MHHHGVLRKLKAKFKACKTRPDSDVFPDNPGDYKIKVDATTSMKTDFSIDDGLAGLSCSDDRSIDSCASENNDDKEDSIFSDSDEPKIRFDGHKNSLKVFSKQHAKEARNPPIRSPMISNQTFTSLMKSQESIFGLKHLNSLSLKKNVGLEKSSDSSQTQKEGDFASGIEFDRKNKSKSLKEFRDQENNNPGIKHQFKSLRFVGPTKKPKSGSSTPNRSAIPPALDSPALPKKLLKCGTRNLLKKYQPKPKPTLQKNNRDFRITSDPDRPRNNALERKYAFSLKDQMCRKRIQSDSEEAKLNAMRRLRLASLGKEMMERRPRRNHCSDQLRRFKSDEGVLSDNNDNHFNKVMKPVFRPCNSSNAILEENSTDSNDYYDIIADRRPDIFYMSLKNEKHLMKFRSILLNQSVVVIDYRQKPNSRNSNSHSNSNNSNLDLIKLVALQEHEIKAVYFKTNQFQICQNPFSLISLICERILGEKFLNNDIILNSEEIATMKSVLDYRRAEEFKDREVITSARLTPKNNVPKSLVNRAMDLIKNVKLILVCDSLRKSKVEDILSKWYGFNNITFLKLVNQRGEWIGDTVATTYDVHY